MYSIEFKLLTPPNDGSDVPIISRKNCTMQIVINYITNIVVNQNIFCQEVITFFLDTENRKNNSSIQKIFPFADSEGHVLIIVTYTDDPEYIDEPIYG